MASTPSSALQKILNLFGWPVVIGLIAGLAIVLSQPQLRYGLGQHISQWFISPQEQPSSYAQAVSRAAPAVVNIFSRKVVNADRNPLFDDPVFRLFFNSSDIPQQQRMSSALGSGVIINEGGYLLTNNHVIANAEEIIVSLYDGREAVAEVVGSDPETDLAVLRIPFTNLRTVTLGEPQKSRVGDIVFAIGYPFGVGQTVTQGIISATGRHGLGINVYENFIQTDAAINPGNSGGALIDAKGNLLGINTAILTTPSKANRSVSSANIGFAVPADMAITIMTDIINSGEVIRGWLGVQAQMLTHADITTHNLPNSRGVIITGVDTNGPADQAGLRPGDVITHINQKPIINGREGMLLIANTRPDDKVQITVLREDQKIQLTAVVGKRPTGG